MIDLSRLNVEESMCGESRGQNHVTLSGGEALMHSNLCAFCEVMKTAGMKISLLSTGLTLEDHAEPVLKYFNEVIKT